MRMSKRTPGVYGALRLSPCVDGGAVARPPSRHSGPGWLGTPNQQRPYRRGRVRDPEGSGPPVLRNRLRRSRPPRRADYSRPRVAFAGALGALRPGLGYWLHEDGDGIPWLLVSLVFIEGNVVHDALGFDFDAAGIKRRSESGNPELG